MRLTTFLPRFRRNPDNGFSALVERISGATVSEVRAMVEEGAVSAADALAAEKAGRNRKTLVKTLREALA